MHVPTEGLSRIITEWLKKKFGGVKPEMLLDPAMLEVLKADAKPVRHRLFIWLIPLLIVVFAALGYGLYALRMAMEGPAVNAIFDTQHPSAVLGFGLAAFMLMLLTAGVAELLLLPRLLGWTPEEWTRYHATVHGWLPRRQLVLLLVPGLLVAAVGVVSGFLLGDRVDDQGIRYTASSGRQTEPYTNVVSVEVYQSFTVPAGVRQGHGVFVRFAGGGTWDNQMEGRSMEVAEFIAKRSGVPVRQIQMRP